MHRFVSCGNKLYEHCKKIRSCPWILLRIIFEILTLILVRPKCYSIWHWNNVEYTRWIPGEKFTSEIGSEDFSSAVLSAFSGKSFEVWKRFNRKKDRQKRVWSDEFRERTSKAGKRESNKLFWSEGKFTSAPFHYVRIPRTCVDRCGACSHVQKLRASKSVRWIARRAAWVASEASCNVRKHSS